LFSLLDIAISGSYEIVSGHFVSEARTLILHVIKLQPVSSTASFG
jgi:hypothetical protein